MLEIANLIGGWGPTIIVEDLSVDVGGSECLAILGRNGVGKTTFLELVVGRANKRGGRIALDGKDISSLSIFERARAGLGYVPQNREVFPSLSVREHLLIAARPGPWNYDKVLELLPRLGQRLDNLGSQLSGGEQQMLAIARALLGNPKLIMMDEPSEGLAPVVVEQLVVALKEIVADGSLSMVLVEQRVDLALELSDRFIIMDRGRITHQARSEEYDENSENLAELMGLTH